MKKVFLLMAVILPFVFASCGDDKNEPAVPDNHEYVDLGLPSGTLWATCNVGANTPEEYGYYFAYNMGCNSSNMFWNDHRYRACGIPVRAVRASQN